MLPTGAATREDSNMARLHIIICSTRPGRVGPAVADWFHAQALAHGGFEVALVDLAQVGLPLYDEPRHPMLQQYEHAHTRAWSRSVASADAFVFVTPEYNYGPPPALVNALNYVYKEWNYKPAAFVSYGGVSGGMRAVQAEKQTLTTLRMVPIFEYVAIPMVAERLDAAGRFQPQPIHDSMAQGLLTELRRFSDALQVLREPASTP